jgi:hypothetical protein
MKEFGQYVPVYITFSILDSFNEFDTVFFVFADYVVPLVFKWLFCSEVGVDDFEKEIQFL